MQRAVSTLLVTGAVAIGALAGAGSAAGAPNDCDTAPGLGAIDQYCESVPTGDGTRRSPTGQTQSQDRPGPSTVSQLRKTPAGRALLASGGWSEAQGTPPGSPLTKPAGKSPSNGSRSTSEVVSPKVPSNNPLKAVRSSVDSGSTAGSGVVWSLVGISVLGAVVPLRRRFIPPLDDR